VKLLKIAVIVLSALVACSAGLFLWLGGPWSLSQARLFRKAVNSADHLAIVTAAVSTIHKSGTNTMLYRGSSLTNLPTIISGLKPSKVWVRPDSMTIEFHGGFDHFGFDIREREDNWEMARYTEQERKLVLTVKKDVLAGEPGGAANRSQPILSEKNQTSGAAGSAR
jgi:hypothetical protein